jgi:ATP-dependent RNA helicase HelY
MTVPTKRSLDTFYRDLSFTPDAFQVDALAALADGRSVVVTAPTGAGKTLIADGAIALAVASGNRAFYTTPIKALSNQKFNDLSDAYGNDRVGLLTGDNVINGDAPIIVMTTEVLRNMIYDDSGAIDDLAVVILDEVHYLADRHRGSVWEEIIIHLDRAIQLVCLSATIANPEEFTDWVRERRGDVDLVVETNRPVPLTSMYMWRDRNSEGGAGMLPVFARNGRANPAIVKLLTRSRGRHRRFSTPRRVEVIRGLHGDHLLPAIYFVFSRKGCDQAAQQIASANLGLTTGDDRNTIRHIAQQHVAHLSPDDLAVLGYERWLASLMQGAGAHHAGLVPAFKEAVEELFLRGLVKVVVATETLALGINMPARTVVLESLSKFNGESHELLEPSSYTQLTGRAGRRGIDEHGTAVVLHSSYVPFDRVSGIAAAGANPLRSSFAPTYNMSVNLIARYDESRAHELLRASFANFAEQTRRDKLRQNIEDRRRDAETFRDAATCHLGNIWAVLDKDGWAKRAKPNTSLLVPGSVIEIPAGKHVLLARSWGGGQPRLDLADSSGRLVRLRSRDLPNGTMIIGVLPLAAPVAPTDDGYRKQAAESLVRFEPSDDPIPFFGGPNASPVLTCPDLDTHLEWADKSRRASRDVRRLERRIDKAETSDVVSEFDGLHTVLDAFGYTDGWTLTPRGEALRRLYNELDLLLAESLRSGVFDNLPSAEFAALLSVFTYESRGGEVAQLPAGDFAHSRIDAIGDLYSTIQTAEKSAKLDPSREPDVGLVDTIHAWASGLELDEIFDAEDVRAGDFVRSARQVLDLLRQVRDGYPEVRTLASDAITNIDRGIVEVGVVG